MTAPPLKPFRLLAVDADGTLLDPEGSLRPRIRAALVETRRRGIEVVVCTGRRFRTVKPLLEDLQLEGPVVVQNGVVVKEGRTGKTIHHRYLAPDLYPPALELMRRAGSPLVYIDAPEAGTDMLCERPEAWHPFQREYVEANRDVITYVDSLDTHPEQPVVMLSCMADLESLEVLAGAVREELGSRVHTHLIGNKLYQGDILEILSPHANKWSALQDVARSQGILADEILAIGDDDNDLPMIRSAGLGVAMGNATASLQEAADFVTQTNGDDGAARAIERWLLDAS